MPATGAKHNIQDRTFRFGCRTVMFCMKLRKSGDAPLSLVNQLLRSATSIGANLEEATAATSRKEFVAICAVALKEARETLYWLRLFTACALAPSSQSQPLENEADALVAILTTIVRRARANLAGN